jgi:CubicO group peptidase (beta-lactamase class C family)
MLKSARKALAVTICLFAFGTATFLSAKAPTIDPRDDAKHFGEPEKVLMWTPEQQVSGYRNMSKLRPTRKITAAGTTLELPERLVDLGGVKINTDERSLSVDEYFEQQNVAGLLVIKDGQIVYERYGLGNTEESLWVAFSVAKSVTSMLIGAAIQDGYIKSVDEKITDYLPQLKNSAYDQSSIRNILQMSSGVAWNEDYADPESDIGIMARDAPDTLQLYEYLRNKPRDAEPGEIFNYNTAETNLAGTLLRSAIGNNLATYLAEKIWVPFGMESDANWMLSEAGGGEYGGCCISATLRDYGRLGLFALNDGKLADGTRVLPEGWMAESTSPSKGYDGYGYFWWLGETTYRAVGIYGQAIFIDPKKNVIIAQHSARAVASNQVDWELQDAFFAALSEAASKQ